MVHAKEKIETVRMEIDDPTKIGTKRTNTQIHACRKDFGRCHIGRQTELSPTVSTLKACAIQQTKCQIAIDRERVFSTHIESSTQSTSTPTFVSIILKLIQIA